MIITGSKPKIMGTGLLALDLVMGLDPDIPIRSWAGGTCGNVLSILAYLGWDAFPIGRMNGDPASQRVKADMVQCGVHLDFISCGPTSNTPIVIQEIRRSREGYPTHRFLWSCPQCGNWLPTFKPVTLGAVEIVSPNIPGTAVFFMDRVSRAALTLAARASAAGAIVFFEPSAKSDPKLFGEALELAHIVKYSDQRLSEASGAMHSNSATLLEIQTLGASGLRYRYRVDKEIPDWINLSAITPMRLSDTCGSGDWCTAGLVAKIAKGGQASLRNSGTNIIRDALQYGQALAAWNCGFEGARGGMYVNDLPAIMSQVNALLKGHAYTTVSPAKSKSETLVQCPACLSASFQSVRSELTHPVK